MSDVAETRTGFFCPACGSPVRPGARFCELPSCGTYVDWGLVQHRTTEDAPAPGVLRPSLGGTPRPTTRRVSCVLLTKQPVVVEPGSFAHADVRVRNDLSVVDRLRLTVTGAAGAMATVSPEVLDLYPGGEADARVTVSPPRGPELAAGDYTYGLHLRSEHGPDLDMGLGRVTVTPFTEVDAELVPSRSMSRLPRIRHQVVLANRGNAPVRVAVIPGEGDGRLTWPVPQRLLEIPLGRRVGTPLRGRRRMRWSGPPESVAFPVTVLTGAAGAVEVPRVLEAEHVSRALLPRWLFPLVLVLATLLAMLLVLRPDPAPATSMVPSVVREDRAAAVAAIQKAGLETRVVEQLSEDVPRDRVVATDPAAGAELPRGEMVTVSVSSGPAAPDGVQVPNVMGLAEDDASAELEATGLEVERVSEATDQPPGTVVRTTPEAGATVEHGSRVTLHVSTTPPPTEVQVPDVLGMTQEEASRTLGALDLTGNVLETTSDEAPGVVVSTNPPPGASVAPGTVVTLSVSTGPPPTPEPDPTPSDPTPEIDLPDELVGLWRLDTDDQVPHQLTLTTGGTYELIDQDGAVMDTGMASTDGTVLTWRPDEGGARTVLEWEVRTSREGAVVLVLDGLRIGMNEQTTWVRDARGDGAAQ